VPDVRLEFTAGEKDKRDRGQKISAREILKQRNFFGGNPV